MTRFKGIASVDGISLYRDSNDSFVKIIQVLTRLMGSDFKGIAGANRIRL